MTPGANESVESSLRILVVDDDPLNRRNLVQQLERVGYTAEGAEDAEGARESLQCSAWDVVLTDLRMPGMDGIEFLGTLKQQFPAVEVILMTGFGSVRTAVDAMRAGAADYLTKPFRFEELDARLGKLFRLVGMKKRLDRLQAAVDAGHTPIDLIARSPGMQPVWERIQLFADHPAPLLVTGETGVGKEVVARAVHARGRRSAEPFVAVASGAIPPDLAESELFGHEKGAFTGAVGRHRGSFERAGSGTLLLDDIDDLPLAIQAKLLRVLQEGTVLRVGGSEESPIDCRVLATTKRDLSEAVAARQFREDLFYRIRGLEIEIPPLRDRGDDVLVLGQYFLQVLGAAMGQADKSIAPPAAEILQQYSWPGNVRELRRVMESAVALAPGAEIAPEHLPGYVHRGRNPVKMFTLHLDHSPQVDFQDLLRSFEEDVLRWGLRMAGGRQTRAAKILQLPRTTLQAKLARRAGE